jgi:hypothetical protein
LRERVVGQDEAIERVSWMVQTFMAGFNPPGRPAGILLFLGPDGFPHSRPLKNLVPTFSSPQRPALQFTAIRRTRLPVCGGIKRSCRKLWESQEYALLQNFGFFQEYPHSVRNFKICGAESGGNPWHPNAELCGNLDVGES